MKFFSITLFYAAACLSLFLFSCDDNNVDTSDDYCYKPTVGDYWVYQITENGSPAEKETDSVVSVKELTDNMNNVKEYTVSGKSGSAEFSWKWYSSDITTRFIMPASLKPIFSRISNLLTETIDVNMPMCGTTTYSSVQEYYEDTKLLLNDSVIDARFKRVYKFEGELTLKTKFNIKSKSFDVNIYDSKFSFWEELVSPQNITFSNGTRIRNKTEKNFKLWMANKLGLVKVEENGGLTKTLIDYKLAQTD